MNIKKVSWRHAIQFNYLDFTTCPPFSDQSFLNNYELSLRQLFFCRLIAQKSFKEPGKFLVCGRVAGCAFFSSFTSGILCRISHFYFPFFIEIIIICLLELWFNRRFWRWFWGNWPGGFLWLPGRKVFGIIFFFETHVYIFLLFFLFVLYCLSMAVLSLVIWRGLWDCG